MYTTTTMSEKYYECAKKGVACMMKGDQEGFDYYLKRNLMIKKVMAKRGFEWDYERGEFVPTQGGEQ